MALPGFNAAKSLPGHTADTKLYIREEYDSTIKFYQADPQVYPAIQLQPLIAPQVLIPPELIDPSNPCYDCLGGCVDITKSARCEPKYNECISNCTGAGMPHGPCFSNCERKRDICEYGVGRDCMRTCGC